MRPLLVATTLLLLALTACGGCEDDPAGSSRSGQFPGPCVDCGGGGAAGAPGRLPDEGEFTIPEGPFPSEGGGGATGGTSSPFATIAGGCDPRTVQPSCETWANREVSWGCYLVGDAYVYAALECAADGRRCDWTRGTCEERRERTYCTLGELRCEGTARGRCVNPGSDASAGEDVAFELEESCGPDDLCTPEACVPACVEQLCDCPDLFEPSCGADGALYWNGCQRGCAGVAEAEGCVLERRAPIWTAAEQVEEVASFGRGQFLIEFGWSEGSEVQGIAVVGQPPEGWVEGAALPLLASWPRARPSLRAARADAGNGARVIFGGLGSLDGDGGGNFDDLALQLQPFTGLTPGEALVLARGVFPYRPIVALVGEALVVSGGSRSWVWTDSAPGGLRVLSTTPDQVGIPWEGLPPLFRAPRAVGTLRGHGTVAIASLGAGGLTVEEYDVASGERLSSERYANRTAWIEKGALPVSDGASGALIAGEVRTSLVDPRQENPVMIDYALEGGCLRERAALRLPGGGLARSPLAARDLDGDGVDELVVAVGEETFLLRRAASGWLTIEAVLARPVGTVPSSPRFVDVDGDGRDEIWTVGSASMIYRGSRP